jgi:hypothetical protein
MNIDVEFHGQLKGMVSEVIVNGNWIIPEALGCIGLEAFLGWIFFIENCL